MYKIYDKDEIPKGYVETIKLNNIDINKVKYVITTTHRSGSRIAEYLGEYTIISTITDETLYIVFDKETY